MPYQVLALLPPNTDLSLDSLSVKLQERFKVFNPQAQVLELRDRVVVRIDQWSMTLYHVSASHVIQESREIAKLFAVERSDKDIIASCDSRVELISDPDPMMMYFNDYVAVLEVLQDIDRAILFDPEVQEFILN